MMLEHENRWRETEQAHGQQQSWKSSCSQPFRSWEEQGASRSPFEASSYFCGRCLRAVLCKEGEGSLQPWLAPVRVCGATRLAGRVSSCRELRGRDAERCLSFLDALGCIDR